MKSPRFVSVKLLAIALIAGLSFSASAAWAQSTPAKLGPPQKAPAMNDAEAVEKVIIDLFDAMRAGDGEKVSTLFVEGTILQSTSTSPQGDAQMNSLPMSQFAAAVGQPRDQVWDERIWDLDIKIDGRLASAWMNYAFYVDETFSHCGVNSVQMFKGSEGWKIMYIADSRQKAACKIPEDIKNAGK